MLCVAGAWCRAGDDRLASTDDLDAARSVVAHFEAEDDAQRAARSEILRFVDEHPDALHRSCLQGHLTGSAWVVDAHGHRGLVLLHAKVGRWLQPGGHADGDGCLAAVALREASEETGIEGLEVWSEPVDVDVHLFVNRRKREPDHLHLDVRYVVRAPHEAVVRGNHESEGLRWVGSEDLDDPELALDTSTRRLARYGFEAARREVR